jgi:catechol 2,3-dioxygenase-like lactoylglutathione lyase family enzyme
MSITIERIEALGVRVRDLPKAEELFSRLFGLDFKSIVYAGLDAPRELVPLKSGELNPDPNTVLGQSGGLPLAIDPTGVFELIETPEGQPANAVYNIHFKVADIDAATAEMQANGIRVISSIRSGGLREVVFHPDDLVGVRICLVEYSGPSLIESILG